MTATTDYPLVTPRTKAIEWSYPTSPNAKRFGFPRGCWTVTVYRNQGQETISGHATIEDAKAAAGKIDAPYDKYSYAT